MKVAFCTNSGLYVDEHFGRAENIAVYEVTPTGYAHLENRAYTAIDGKKEHSSGEKAESLSDCAILYVAEIGGPAAAQVVRNKIHPVKVTAVEPIDSLLERLTALIATNPPPWLKKILYSEGTYHA